MTTHPLPIRAATLADLKNILTVLEARDLKQAGRIMSDAEDVQWRWREAGFDAGRDAWVATDRDRVIAYAISQEDEIEVHVHPSYLGRGLGTELRSRAERRALEAAAGAEVTVKQNPSSLDPGALALLEAAGYRAGHHYTRMERTVDDLPPPPPLPDGVALRTYRLGPDDRALHAAHTQAWQEYSVDEWEPDTFESWMNQTKGDDFDPRFWTLAVEDDRIVAFSLCFKYPDMIWLQALGTIPSHRHRGLGRILLIDTLGKARDGGYGAVGLTVSSRNLADARRLYEDVGFAEKFRYVNMRKTLRSG